jgi:F0F1-type ATP synthase assembly protein I
MHTTATVVGIIIVGLLLAWLLDKFSTRLHHSQLQRGVFGC